MTKNLFNYHHIMNVIFTFTLTIVFSICIAYIVNQWKYGKYIVGGIGRMKYDTFYKSYKNNLVD